MSIQRNIFYFMAHYLIRRGMQKGVDVSSLRASNMPEPNLRQNFGCTFESGNIEGVRVTFVRPAEIRSNKVFVHLHGGMYVSGIGEIHWQYLARVCQEKGCLGVMVDYRLAPEHPFPAALEDTLVVLRAMVELHGADNVVVSGDSAGGGLAIAGSMSLRDAGEDLPEKLVLLSPWIDITMENPEVELLVKKDRMLTRIGLVEAGAMYAGEEDPKMPYLSPVMGDLSGLPPMLIQIGTYELLLPDCRLFKEKAAEQGVELVYQEYPKLFHVWTLLFAMLPEGEEALQEVFQFIG